MKLVVLLAAAVAATPVEHLDSKSPLVQEQMDSKATSEVAEPGADREGKCKLDCPRHFVIEVNVH